MEKGPALWLRTCFNPVSQDRVKLDLQNIDLVLNSCIPGYVLHLNINHFQQSAEYCKMQKQTSQALFSTRLLLTSKSYAVRSRHLHPSIVNHSTPVDHLTFWCSASLLSKRRCLGPVTGIYQKRQTRGESTIEKAIGAEKGKQNKAPWHREGSDIPPVARQRSAGAMIKGSRVRPRAYTLTDLRLRKAVNNPISSSQAHPTSHHS